MPDSTCPSRILRLAAELKDLAQIRHFVQDAAGAFGVVPDVLPDLLLAVDEAVTNVIVHGYAGRGGPVEIKVARQPDALTIRLRDEARPFDPTGVPAPDLTAPLDERASGGLGIYLIRQAMDELIYHRQPGGGNELTMIKRMA